MGAAQGTFHKYITELYRAFGVNGRAALQARFAARGGIETLPPVAADPQASRLRREGAPMTKPWRAPRTFGVRPPS